MDIRRAQYVAVFNALTELGLQVSTRELSEKAKVKEDLDENKINLIIARYINENIQFQEILPPPSSPPPSPTSHFSPPQKGVSGLPMPEVRKSRVSLERVPTTKNEYPFLCSNAIVNELMKNSASLSQLKNVLKVDSEEREKTLRSILDSLKNDFIIYEDGGDYHLL